ncbi:hypothetical protein [Polaribacter marinivivus]|uniref:hypothetical protein n=1 Tax=Polaribacter marinivivus TaxID=1524260 RepID=UPI003D331B93
MENPQVLLNYLEWLVVILTTIMFFNFYSKNIKKIGKLLLLVLPSSWVIISVFKGVGENYSQSINRLSSFEGFTLLLAETLPMLVLIGGITFYFKYRKFKKKMN